MEASAGVAVVASTASNATAVGNGGSNPSPPVHLSTLCGCGVVALTATTTAPILSSRDDLPIVF